MKEQQFVEVHESQWQALEHFFWQRERGTRQQALLTDFPPAYRALCEQLVYAENAGFSPALLARLQRLAMQGHQLLYRRQRGSGAKVAAYFLYELPQAVRREWRYLALATALFVLPMLAALGVGLLLPEVAAEQAQEYAEMYKPDENRRIGESRGADSDVAMFGHYLSNNTGIGLRTVAGGALLGIGVLVSLVLNGWLLGIVSAHMITLGYAGVTFFPFVITHAAFELTAIVFSGACGLALARGLFMPGRQRRGDAVRALLQRFFPILVALVLLFFVAALVEAFWSAIWLPPALKYLSGAVCWALVIAYFSLAGRGYAPIVD
mgnify:FL=1